MTRHGIFRGRWWRIAAALLIVIVVLVVAASYLVDEPLRRSIARAMNQRLKGYAVHLGAVSFHPLGFSIDLKDLVIVQQEHPDPPVFRIDRLHASVHWGALLGGALVADFALDRPRIHIDLPQLEKEARDKAPVAQRGWQDAFQAIYPLKINLFRIRGGDIMYIDEDPHRPLHISGITLRAENIRNIRSREHEYPSEVRADGTVFGKGRLAVDGNADFLKEPFPGILAGIALDNVDMGYFKPILARSNLDVTGGVLSAHGEIEYAPRIRRLDLTTVTIRNARIDYIHHPATAQREKEQREQIKEAAREVANKPKTVLRVRELRVLDSGFGLVNKAANPAYRVYMDHAQLIAKNVSNQERQGSSTYALQGAFMGSGTTVATATFRPETKGPDFEINIRIEGTRMPAMNDLFRAYGNFDVAKGSFSFYSEMRIKDGRINGYMKPIFQDLKVYDKRKDKDKKLIHRVYERVVGLLAHILENKPRHQIATQTTISGPAQSPRTSTWQIVVKLIQNAFFQAILPGFERQLVKPGG